MNKILSALKSWLRRPCAKEIAVFLFAAFVGLSAPIAAHIVVGWIWFLPLPEDISYTDAEAEIVRRIFVFLGSCSILLPVVASVCLVVPRTKTTLAVAAFLAGMGLGAAVTMGLLSPGGWAFITEPPFNI